MLFPVWNALLSTLHVTSSVSNEFIQQREITKKLVKTYETMISDTGHQVAQANDPRKNRNKQGEPRDCPRLLPGESIQRAASRGGA